jgi:hypothetical protein
MPGLLGHKESRSPARARAWFVPAGTADKCLKCRQKAAGKRYGFYAVRKNEVPSELVHEESAFVCDQCARACLGLRPWWLEARLFLISLAGTFGVLFSLALLHNLILALVLFIGTVQALRHGLRKLDYARRQLYHRDPEADRKITRLAIRLRKAAILQELGLPASQVLFITQVKRVSS